MTSTGQAPLKAVLVIAAFVCNIRLYDATALHNSPGKTDVSSEPLGTRLEGQVLT